MSIVIGKKTSYLAPKKKIPTAFGANEAAYRRELRRHRKISRLGGLNRPPWDGLGEMEALREACRRDFWTFFLYAFGAGSNPKGRDWIDPDIHQPMARWFQHHIEDWEASRKYGRGEKKNLAILVHRGAGKTTMFTRAGQLWLHLRNPETSTYTGSENTALSGKMLAAMKAVLDGSDDHALWTRLYGNWSSAARTWTGKEVVHAARRNTSRQDPSLGIFAVETSITGSHPDAIFYDDPISYERLESDTNWLRSVNSQVSSLIPVIQSDGLIVWVGTRYDDGDHFGVAFSEEGVASLSGMETDSIRPEEGGKWHVYFMAARDRNGKPSHVKVWPEKELRAYQKNNPLRYAAQVMNDPSTSEHNPITREQIGQCVIDPSHVPWSALRFAICCDTAFSDGTRIAGKDETVFVVHGYPRNGSGDVYVIEGYGSIRWRAEDFGNRLVATCQRYRSQGRKIFRITDETTRAGKKGVWAISLRNMFADANEPFPGGTLLEFERGDTKKYSRLSTAATFWVDGHVRVVKGAPGVDRLMEQMAKIGQYAVNPRTKIDWADAHSDAFQPQLYNPMRPNDPKRPPWDRGAYPISIDGLDTRQFDDDDMRVWRNGNPRPPLGMED